MTYEIGNITGCYLICTYTVYLRLCQVH